MRSDVVAWLAATPTTPEDAWLRYGLAGLLVVTVILPMAIYIVRDKEKQIRALQEEVARQRGELADLRRTLDPVASSMTRMSHVMELTNDTLVEALIRERGKGGGEPRT